MPWIDKSWNKNPILAYLRPSTASPILKFAMTRAKARQGMEKEWATEDEVNDRDMLSRFVEAQAKDPDVPSWSVCPGLPSAEFFFPTCGLLRYVGRSLSGPSQISPPEATPRLLSCVQFSTISLATLQQCRDYKQSCKRQRKKDNCHCPALGKKSRIWSTSTHA